ncbi:MAG: universal stress protein [Pseudomonadota bacterium]
MAKYKKVLLALDLGADNKEIIEQARQVIADHGAELLLVHAHEPTLTAYQAGGMAAISSQIVSLDEELRKVEEKKLAEVCKELGVPEDKCYMPFGRASTEIKRIAEDQDVDLIVIGTHGQKGLGLLLGSTANAVLHGVTCDVLAVRTARDD